MDLARFYADRLDEAERRALLFLADPTGRRDSTRALQLEVDAGAYVEWFGPAWVLRQVEAGRKILAEVIPEIIRMDEVILEEWCSPDEPSQHLRLLRIMVAVFSDHPGYKPDWGTSD